MAKGGSGRWYHKTWCVWPRGHYNPGDGCWCSCKDWYNRERGQDEVTPEGPEAGRVEVSRMLREVRAGLLLGIHRWGVPLASAPPSSGLQHLSNSITIFPFPPSSHVIPCCFSNTAHMLLPYCHAKAMLFMLSGLLFPKIPVWLAPFYSLNFEYSSLLFFQYSHWSFSLSTQFMSSLPSQPSFNSTSNCLALVSLHGIDLAELQPWSLDSHFCLNVTLLETMPSPS